MSDRELPTWISAPLELALLVLIPARGPREAGRRTGVWSRMLSGGRRLSETTFERGLRHGVDTRWYLSGRKRFVGQWRSGEKTGEWFYFHRNGKLDGRRTGKYEKGLRFAALKGFNDWNA
jgi:antitoxin component YwqK of YwqJK toxin-antitoxin module